MDELEWWVLLPRSDNELYFNIFNSVRFRECLVDLKTEGLGPSVEGFEERILNRLMYSFWCKAEYEIMVTYLFHKNTHKIDVYSQVKPNLKHLCEYLKENWDKIPVRKKRRK